jgi:hypothetical protein
LTLAIAGSSHAQEALPPNVARVIDATVGNDVLQLRYLTQGPIIGMKSNLGCGVLATDNRELIAASP